MMHKVLLFILIFLTLAASAQVRRQNVEVPQFTQITVASGINLIIKKSDKRQLVVEGERNAIANTICTVDSAGMLSISANRYKYRKVRRINVYIDIDTTLSYISIKSSRVRFENEIAGESLELKSNFGGEYYCIIDMQRLKVHLDNSSKLQLFGKVADANIFLDQNSTIDAYKLDAKRMEITIDNSAEANVNVSDALVIYGQHQAVVRYDGKPALTTQVVNCEVKPRFSRNE